MDTIAKTISAKNRDFLSSADPFSPIYTVFGARIRDRFNGGGPGPEWVSLEADLSHIATVANFSRPNLRVSHRLHSQVMEAELALRTEWMRLARARTDL